MEINNTKLKNLWRNCNNSSFTFASSIPLNMWDNKPFSPRFSKYSWEIACIIRTRLCYLEAFKTGDLKFNSREGILNKKDYISMSKSQILTLLKATAQSILDQIAILDDFEKLTYFIWLLQHERIHQGKLLLYHSNLGLEIPQSFKKTWGKDNFPIK